MGLGETLLFFYTYCISEKVHAFAFGVVSGCVFHICSAFLYASVFGFTYLQHILLCCLCLVKLVKMFTSFDCVIQHM